MRLYLHKVNEIGWVLDHRLTPEVRALFCAMASRLPVGGIEARYDEIVNAIAWDIMRQDDELGPYLRQCGLAGDDDRAKAFKSDHMLNSNVDDPITLGEVVSEDLPYRIKAQELLCTYPLHPRVQAFFDKNVRDYGHSSVMEQTGSPSVYIQGVSPWTAYLSFDSPLVAGQEFSTRAVRRKDWPMAAECLINDVTTSSILQAEDERLLREIGGQDIDLTVFQAPMVQKPHPDLASLHNDWLDVFDAEVEAWKDHLSIEENRKALGVGDNEPFRPALDRARWAIPSTIATGFSHTANVRAMGRVVQGGLTFLRVSKVWPQIKETYEAALPGMKGLWLKEAVAEGRPEVAQIPAHLFSMRHGRAKIGSEVSVDLMVDALGIKAFSNAAYIRTKKGYLDPLWNQLVRVHIEFQCSWAVARDWHRHRTGWPWTMGIVYTSQGSWVLHHAFEPKSLLGKTKASALFIKSQQLHEYFLWNPDHMEKAMLCLPFGTTVSMRTSMGLRDAVYMLELRRDAVGANYEYASQATQALEMLRARLHEHDIGTSALGI